MTNITEAILNQSDECTSYRCYEEDEEYEEEIEEIFKCEDCGEEMEEDNCLCDACYKASLEEYIIDYRGYPHNYPGHCSIVDSNGDTLTEIKYSDDFTKFNDCGGVIKDERAELIVKALNAYKKMEVMV